MSDFAKEKDCFISHLLQVRNLSERTARSYGSDLDIFEVWAKRAGLDPLKLEYRDLRLYLAEQSASKYARSTIARRLASLRTFYDYLIQEGKLEANPAKMLATPKQPRRLPKALSADDIERLLGAPDTTTHKGLRDAALLELLYASGGRVSEIATLQLNDLRLDESSALVHGKGGKDRFIPLHSLAIDRLERYIAIARPALHLNPTSTAVFLSSRGNPLSADAIRRIVRQVAKAAGITHPVSPHSLRHTFATDLLNNGADLRSVQELLGHANLSTTQIYTHITAKRLSAIHKQAHPRSDFS